MQPKGQAEGNGVESALELAAERRRLAQRVHDRLCGKRPVHIRARPKVHNPAMRKPALADAWLLYGQRLPQGSNTSQGYGNGPSDDASKACALFPSGALFPTQMPNASSRPDHTGC